LSDQFIPIKFVWYDCGDNSFSDPSGNYLYVDSRIYNAEGILIWDEEDDVNYPESARETGQGAPDECVEGGDKAGPMRCVEFIHGGICVIHADSIDYRGDVNLNNISYEIADVVVFNNYFIYGLGAFKINTAGQIAATDVNADGLTLSVADLVYLIRVVVGDADPLPKLVPYNESLVMTTEYKEESINICTDAPGNIGGAFFTYDMDPNINLGEPYLSKDAEGMSLGYNVVDGELRLLIYDIGSARIKAGLNTLVEIPFSGGGKLTLTKAEIVDYDGRPFDVVEKESILPIDFVLNQNYPNPFNPTTTISFTLPQSSRWSLKIFNITGCLVNEYIGNDDAGLVSVEWDGRSSSGVQAASGVYLYRLEASGFNDTKKMILLK